MKKSVCIAIISLVMIWANIRFAHAQKKYISITIDDVPNTAKYENEGFDPLLLNTLDAMNIPFAIFINEEKVYKTEHKEQNISLLESWISHERASLGNHTYSHSRYSAVGFDNFVKDIENGEVLIRHYAKRYNKELKHFRFPYNDLGEDSLQHVQLRQYLEAKGYTFAPFTVESSDWMFDFVYRHYLKMGEIENAKAIGKMYVEKTLDLISFFEEMATSIYERRIKHIYLCHDNAINADFLPTIIDNLQQKGYEIIDYDEALKDAVYRQEDRYYKKWGVSWLYRWMDTQEERVKWMKQEPDLSEINKCYEEILK